MQIRRETSISNDIKDHLELKYRKVNEHINKKWEYTQNNKNQIEQHVEQSISK